MMIVVTGATGNVGLPLVRMLSAAAHGVVGLSRGSSGVDLPDGVEHRRADLAVPESLPPAFDGAKALFLLVAGAGAHLSPSDILAAARTAGIRRVVLLSSQVAGTRPDSVSHAPLRRIEIAVQQSEMEWTILRPGGFHTNAFAWAPAVRSHRTVAAPFGDVALPSVDPADIAELAAAALTADGHAGRSYELTGPAPVSPRERVQAIGAALAENVRFVELSRAEARAQMIEFMPAPVVEGTLDILGAPSPAEQRVSPDVERVLGRAPRSFADWAVRHAAAFR